MAIFFMVMFDGGAWAVEYTWEDLCRIALQRSEKIRIAEENVALAQAGKDKKRAALIPKLSAYGSYTDYTENKYSPSSVIPSTKFTLPGTVIQPNNAGAWGVRLDHALTLNGREITDFNIARENIQRQKNEADAQKEEYLMTVSAAYYEMLRAQKVMEIADATVERLPLIAGRRKSASAGEGRRRSPPADGSCREPSDRIKRKCVDPAGRCWPIVASRKIQTKK